MIIICITLIVIVALICATQIYPLWVEHDRKTTEKAMKIVAEVREENNRLRKELDVHLSEYVDEFKRRDKTISEIFEKLYELTEKLDKE